MRTNKTTNHLVRSSHMFKLLQTMHKLITNQNLWTNKYASLLKPMCYSYHSLSLSLSLSHTHRHTNTHRDTHAYTYKERKKCTLVSVSPIHSISVHTKKVTLPLPAQKSYTLAVLPSNSGSAGWPSLPAASTTQVSTKWLSYSWTDIKLRDTQYPFPGIYTVFW